MDLATRSVSAPVKANPKIVELPPRRSQGVLPRPQGARSEAPLVPARPQESNAIEGEHTYLNLDEAKDIMANIKQTKENSQDPYLKLL